MTIKKVKLNDIAKDLNVPVKEVAELLANHYGMEPKKPTSALNEQEINVIFEHYTAQNQVSDFNAYFASRDEAPKAKPEKAENRERAMTEYINKIRTERMKRDAKENLMALTEKYRQTKGYGG